MGGRVMGPELVQPVQGGALVVDDGDALLARRSAVISTPVSSSMAVLKRWYSAASRALPSPVFTWGRSMT